MKLKHISLITLVLALVCLLILPAHAEAATSGNLTYSVYEGKVTIKECAPSATGTIKIPAKLGGYPVKSIGSDSFSNCHKVTSVIIPEGVTTIAHSAFYGNSGIKSVTIPSTVKTIGENAFTGCEKLTSIKIPAGVTTIENSAFSNCDSLKTVTLPSSITSIGNYAFSNCNSLTSITIPDSVTYIGHYAFKECRSLKSIRIPDQVTSIGMYAFAYCSALENATIGSGVNEINTWAFAFCTKLKKVNIPSGVTRIPSNTFYLCTALTTVSIPSSVESIAYYAFFDCSKLSTVYYGGTKAQWNDIFIGMNNDPLEKSGVVRYVTPVKITTQPKNAAALSGSNVSSKVAASGSDLSYTWYINDGKGYKKTSVTTATYSTTMNSQCDGRTIYCIVKDKYGFTVKSGVATLSMKPATKLVITKQPVSVTVIKNKTAKISVSAKGDDLTYQWYYKTKSGSSFKKLSSAKSSSYSLKMTSSNTGRQMYCVIKDRYGNSVKSSTVTLKVAPAVKITKQPTTTVKAVAGKKVSVTVKVTGDGLKYQWYYKNKGSSSFKKYAAGTTATYSTTMSAGATSRQVYCVVTDKYGQTVKSKTTTFYANTSITKQPVSTKAAVGKSATVSVTAVGEKLTYKWYYKDPGAKSFKKASTTKSSYSCTMTAAISGRQVYCAVSSKYGGTVKSSTVTLKVAPKPKITTQPTTTVKAVVGKKVSVTVKASGEGLKYQWYYKNKGSASFKKYAAGTAATYSTTMSTGATGRQVYCVVTDKYGQTVKTKTTTFYANVSITAQPSSVTVASGESATASVSAVGEGLTYKWYKKDTSDSEFSLDSAITGATYSLEMSEVVDGRQVYCIITDKFGDTATTDTVTFSLPEVQENYEEFI